MTIIKKVWPKIPDGAWRYAHAHKPPLTKAERKPNAFGVQVLIWPPYTPHGDNEYHVAFYGCRATDKPNFYLHGRVIPVDFWM
ncbi:MAG: hypothetical protein JWP34_4743, partial [Massilia sp.]|nr:hypothetical protein [Massilia sp.]